METEKMFIAASRKKLRFETRVGLIGVEELWDLPLSSENETLCLDEVAIACNKKVEESKESGSFVKKQTRVSTLAKLRFEIVKLIIDVKLAEVEKKENALLASEHKNKLLAILAKKKDAVLEDLDIEELEKEIQKL